VCGALKHYDLGSIELLWKCVYVCVYAYVRENGFVSMWQCMRVVCEGYASLFT